ncbi:MAG: sugar ABC transporter ATP-binding protein [Planctomycetota bacterium]
MTPILSFREVSRRFAAVQALDHVSFDIRRGEVHAVVGENGAGKSTLMKIVAGVISQYDGKVLVHGQQVRFQNPRDAEAAGIGIIHQELNSVPQLSVAASLFLGREITRWPGLLDEARMEQQASQLLAPLDASINPRARMGTLRIGDQQLVEIARALALQPAVLVMDEPTSALSETEVRRLKSIIRSLQDQGTTILYISHRMDEIFSLADRITVLRDGQFIATLETQATSPKQIAGLMVGRDLPPLSPRRPPDTHAEAVLEVHALSLAPAPRSTQPQLQNISLELRRGEILGLAGLLGAGRTELLECLAGASVRQHSGKILRNGRPCELQTPAQAIRNGIALVTEDRKRLGLFQQLPVLSNITIASLKRLSRMGIVRHQQESAAAGNAMRQMHVKGAADVHIAALSGGNQQKCLIARALLTHPQILLLDDPTRGVDVAAKAEIHSLLCQLAHQGLSIIVTSGELPELLSLCDRILVLASGRLTAEFSRNETTEQRIMEAATGQANEETNGPESGMREDTGGMTSGHGRCQ